MAHLQSFQWTRDATLLRKITSVSWNCNVQYCLHIFATDR